MPENRLRAHALIPLLVGQIAVGPTGLFPVRSSFLPCLQLGAVALESLLVQVEDARIARALATIVLARPERRDRWRIVVSGKLGHARDNGSNRGKSSETVTADPSFRRKWRAHLYRLRRYVSSPNLLGPAVPLKNPHSISTHSWPMIGTKFIKNHQPDLSRSCQRLT
jgi:hypothetical protein